MTRGSSSRALLALLASVWVLAACTDKSLPAATETVALQELVLSVQGEGDRDGLRLDELHARTPTGTLDGRGDVAWSPALRFGVDATLAGFDPAAIAAIPGIGIA